MIITQAALIVLIVFLAFLSPKETPWALAVIALLIAFTSASQDIVIDAYRTDVLSAEERGLGTAVFVTGYRIGMIVSGAAALIIADKIGWQYAFMFMAAVMSFGVIGALLSPKPKERIIAPLNLQEAVIGPLIDYFKRKSSIALLFLIILYKLGDAYAGTLTTAFLIKGMNFTPTDVGTINKGVGLICLIVGSMAGGTLMIRLGLFRSLFFFGLLQALSNASFMALAWVGKSYTVMLFAVSFENFTGGMGTAAFVSLIMAMCSKRFSATQYALLSSLASLGRVIVAPSSGFIVELIGWANFFALTIITALPGIALLLFLRKSIPDNNSDRANE
ncbi:AmpG protein [Candidatus Magnetoovum chiemensis]|nr:AmpG protein [Candidatus Magnetoovum chiemensis]